MKKIYIILMNTGTMPSKIIKNVTRYKYSHVVLSLDKNYQKLYSFGRKVVNNPFDAGLVTYGIDSDFFKKFNDTKCAIYELEISLTSYQKLIKLLKDYEKNVDIYKYDIKGLMIRYFTKKDETRENYFVCSQFVATLLKDSDIWDFGKETSLVKPEDFASVKWFKKIYEGPFLEVKK